MLCRDMAETGLMGDPREYFIKWNPERIGDKGARRLMTLIKRRTINGVFSVKLMANQLPRLDACMKGDGATMLSGADDQFANAHKALRGASWVFLTRRNITRQAISRLLAIQTGVYHAFIGNSAEISTKTDTGPVQNNAFLYEQDTITTLVREIQEENLLWEMFFERWQIKPVRIDYEAYCEDRAFYLQKICDAAGLGALVTIPQSVTKKLAGKHSQNHYKKWRTFYFENLTARWAERFIDSLKDKQD